VARLVTLVGLEDEIERELGRILVFIGSRGGWTEIGARGPWEFSEEALGWSRSTACGRAWLARSLRRFPILREAYESGRIGYEKALLVRRALGEGAVEPALERQWVSLAEGAKVKRMRDELRLLRRRQVGDAELGGEPGSLGNGVGSGPEDGRFPKPEPGEGSMRSALPPATDAVWRASLRRDPGMARERVARLGRQAVGESDPGMKTDVFLNLPLPEDLARLFQATLEKRREALEASVPPGAKGEGDDAKGDREGSNREGETALGAGEIAPGITGLGALEIRASLLAVRTFSSRGWRVPQWVALLSLLEDYVETYDDPRSFPRREWAETYARAGWRCEAPGCTARRRLGDHHIVYRSDHGSDEPWNQLCLCAFHHLQGEHGTLARVRGRAPLDVVWRLGSVDRARWYRNEKEIPPPTT
jgi:hypothetical protein